MRQGDAGDQQIGAANFRFNDKQCARGKAL
jgi:hypothetical protein